jgi:hypothetical protein
MGLTPQEAQELAMLQKELTVPASRSPNSRLTVEEQAELDSLTAELAPIQDQAQEQGFFSTVGQGIANGAVAVGEFVDSYGGAPTRAAIEAGANGSNPLSAFANQFGEDPKLAPTGKEVAESLGFDNTTGQYVTNQKTGMTNQKTVSDAGVVGLGIDIVADPLNFIPMGLIAKTGGKIAKGTAKTAARYALKGSVAGIDALSGTKTASRIAETTSKYTDEVAKSAKNWFNPKVADDFDEFKRIANENNIDPSILPETVEFGQGSSVATKARQVADGPSGELVKERFYKASGATEGALESKVATMSGGKVFSPAEAGQFLTESHNKAVKEFFDQDFLTYGKIVEENPGLMLSNDALKSVKSKMTGLKNSATGRLRRGIGGQREEAANFLKDVDILERSLDKNGNMSFKRANELLGNIGEEAFKKYPAGTKIPSDQKKLQELYFSLRESMVGTTAQTLGPNAANKLAVSNQMMTDFLKENGRIKKIFSGDLSREEVFKSIQGFNLDEIQSLKEVMNPEDFQKFKGMYANSLIVRNAQGSPMWKTTIKKMAQKSDHLISVLGPEDTKKFSELLKLGDRIGDPVLNRSATNVADRFSFKNFAGEIISGGADQVTLEELKASARGSKSIPAQSKVIPKKTSGLERLPISSSKFIQFSNAGKMASNKERNDEIEKRKRAISGSKNGKN